MSAHEPIISDEFVARKIRITNSAVAIGEGVVTVCTLNHGMGDMASPAVSYLIRSLVNRAMSDGLKTPNHLTPKEFSDMFRG